MSFYGVEHMSYPILCPLYHIQVHRGCFVEHVQDQNHKKHIQTVISNQSTHCVACNVCVPLNCWHQYVEGRRHRRTLDINVPCHPRLHKEDIDSQIIDDLCVRLANFHITDPIVDTTMMEF